MSTYEISQSSLLSLKAEILRKQQELSKVKKDNTVKILNLKKNAPLDLKNKGVEQRGLNDISEDEDILRKSKAALEAKSKLYDRLSKQGGKHSEDPSHDSNRFLVQFEKKSGSHCSILQDEEEDVDDITDDYEPPQNFDEEWVEYTDCLGRTRTCMRKDLTYLKSKDAELRASIDIKDKEEKTTANEDDKKVYDNSEEPQPDDTTLTEEDELLSNDMRRELQRKQWEKEEEELRNKTNVHYQDILFGEARTHGVGYFSFSKDEEERAQQQEALRKLRDETHEKQKRAQEMRALREKQLAARAKAARNRKRIRMGLPPEEDELDAPKEEDSSTKEVLPVTEEKKSEEEKAKELKRRRHVRPWDIGKEGVKEHYEYTQEEWVEKQRKERKTEFAPPSSYQRGFKSTVTNYKVSEEDKHSLYFSSKKVKESDRKNESDGRKRRTDKDRDNVTATFKSTPIENEIECMEESSGSINPYKTSSLYDSDDDSEANSSRGRGAEIAPPPTFDYYGPNNPKRIKTNNATDLEDSIAAGLKYLRQEAEKKRCSGKHDADMFIM